MAKKRIKHRRNKKGLGLSFDPGKIDWRLFIVCVIVVSAVALIGSAYTQIDSWYESVKPSITPPNWVFPVVWTVLFYLIAVSLYYVWLNSDNKEKRKIKLYFGINFILNILWSVLFFTLHSPIYAFVVIILLLVSIVHLMIFNWKIKKEASYFLIPYLLWVGFAMVLNFLTIGRV